MQGPARQVRRQGQDDRPAPIRRDVRERRRARHRARGAEIPGRRAQALPAVQALEILVPFLRSPPDFAANAANAAVEYAKNIGMALYFGCDHVVWAHAAGVVKDAALAKNMQKLSLWGWFIASCAGLYSQTGDLTDALDDMTDANREESVAVAVVRRRCDPRRRGRGTPRAWRGA